MKTDIRLKAAQLVIPRIDGQRLKEISYREYIESLVDKGIGGFILFRGSLPETAVTIAALRKRARMPLLITSDIERGLGQQLTGGTRFPNQWAVAEAIEIDRAEDVDLLWRMLASVRDECLAAGIDVVFSPVADVNVNRDNPIICTRSFGDEPDRVSWFVREYVKGLQSPSSGANSNTPLLACAKHFPGHGDTAVDSHTSLPIINADMKRLEDIELPPFRAAIGAGVASIMIGHLQVPALEPEPIPATFSKRIVTGLLREKMRFKGLVVTDALDMGALRSICDEGEAAVRCIEAGCDIILHPMDALKVADAISEAVEERRVSIERLDESYERVMAAKKRVHEAGCGTIPLQGAPDVANEISRKAIRVRKGSVAVPGDKISCFVVDDDGDGGLAGPFLDLLAARFKGMRRVSSPSEVWDDETVIIPIFSRVGAWKGSSGLSNLSREKVERILGREGRKVLISFGSPYILDGFDADVMIDAFDPAECMQKAAVEILSEMSSA